MQIQLGKALLGYVPVESLITPRLLKEISVKLKNTSYISLIGGLPKVQKLSQSESIAKIRHYYKNGKLALVLGAGVSMELGIPDWNTLLQELMIKTIEQEPDFSITISKLFTEIFLPSPLIAGRYLQKYYLEKRLSFEEEVRTVLYKNLDLNKDSELMNQIVNYCAAPNKKMKLNSIITYNFDNLLELKLTKFDKPIKFKAIYGTKINNQNNLPIYHVHGFIPNEGDISKDNEITFGESVYHKQYSEIYSWNNIVQINKFRDANCLFIGSSLTDPNLRRLLDIGRQQKVEDNEYHFIFKKKHEEAKVKQRIEILIKENNHNVNESTIAELESLDILKILIEIIERFEEEDATSLGLKIIWVDEWAEVPEILQEIGGF
jgi:SIR2-like domain